MTHDNTSAVMKKFQTIGVKKIHDPRQLVFALDHDIQNQDESIPQVRGHRRFREYHGNDFYRWARAWARDHGGARKCSTGSFVVGSTRILDMYGALGAWERRSCAPTWRGSATGDFWWQLRSIQVVLEGTLPGVLTGKDVVIDHAVAALQPTTKYRTRLSNSAVQAWLDFRWTLDFPFPTCPPNGGRCGMVPRG